MTTPFIVYALPRSRTFWLSRFLTYGDYDCAHEQARHVRSADDLKTWLDQDCTGTAETAAAPAWRLIHHYRPDLRTLVVRRPVEQVVDSLMRLDLRGVTTFDRADLTQRMTELDRHLDRIEQRVPGVLSVTFDSLKDEATGGRVFEHCLPYKHDPAWWAEGAPINLQCNMRALLRHQAAHAPHLAAAAASIASATRAAVLSRRKPAAPPEGVTIQAETCQSFWRDAQFLIAAHAREVGARPGVRLNPNLPLALVLEQHGALQIVSARANGKMVGYLVTLISASIEDRDMLSAIQNTFYVSPEFRGLGLRLQRASIEMLREKGVGEVNLRAGVRGSGPRLGTLYRRVGAAHYGELYNLILGAK